MPSLTTYLTAKHIQQIHRGKVVVIVENEDDIPFWKGVFEHFEINTKIFAGISSPKRLQRGKETVLKQKGHANKQYVLCVDSDYDYLIQNDENNIHANPFIFQTYTYSYENYVCLPKTLRTVCSEICLSDELDFDFVDFFEKYSEIVYPLFLYHLYDKINHNSKNFPISAFYFCIDLPQHPKIHNNGATILANIEKNVIQKYQEIKAISTIAESEIQELETTFEYLGLFSQNSYLFLRGHNVFDNTTKLLEQICYPVIEAQKKKFHSIEKNKLNAYLKDIKTVKTALQLNKAYQKCELFEKIEKDIAH